VVGRLDVLADRTRPHRRVQQRRQPGHVRPAIQPTPRLQRARGW
jgi:hypothetical protein